MSARSAALAALLLSTPGVARATACTFDDPRCEPGEVCLPGADGDCLTGRCTTPDAVRWPVVPLPIAAGEDLYCLKGPLQRPGDTHNACEPTLRWAVDLGSPAHEPPRVLVAPFAGTAWPVSGCSSFDLNVSGGLDPCNLGLGNTVRIVAGGRYVQLAHVSAVLVQWGEWVEAGQPVAIEGSSGNAGNRHVHMSLHEGDPRLPWPADSQPFSLRTADGSVPVAALTCAGPPEARRLVSSTPATQTSPGFQGVDARWGALRAWAASDDARVREHALKHARSLGTAEALYWASVGLIGTGSTRSALDLLDALDGGPPWLATWIPLQRARAWATLGQCRRFRRELARLDRRDLELDDSAEAFRRSLRCTDG